MKEKKTENMGKVWATRIKVLLISGVLASIANMIYDWRTGAEHIHLPWEVFPVIVIVVEPSDTPETTPVFKSTVAMDESFVVNS